MPKKQKVFMPPQAVRDSGESIGTITLDEVRKMYRGGSKIESRWARRILRQEGILKASVEGSVQVPVAVDLQLGPEIFAGIIPEKVDDVVAKFDKASLSASCLPVEDGTLAFFVDYPGEFSEVKETDFPVEKFDNAGMVMIDESKAKIKSIMRAVWKSKDTVGFSCYKVDDPTEVAGIEFDDLFLLKAPDSNRQSAQIIKVDKSLGLVLGWAIISTIDGVPYFDKQGDHITDEAMLEAATDFMINSRVQGDMHEKIPDSDGEEVSKGVVVFAWPMTSEIAKAYGIETDQTGLMIAIKPDDPDILEKYEDGTYSGFSISGKYIDTEEVD